MNSRSATCLRLLTSCLFALAGALLAPSLAQAQYAYVTNGIPNGTVRVIDTATNEVIGAPIDVGGSQPSAIAVTPDGSRAYVVNFSSSNVSVIDTATTELVGEPIAVGDRPHAIAITPDGSRAYVVNSSSSNVSVIDTATDEVIGDPIPVEASPWAIAITLDGSRAYVTSSAVAGGGVSVIDTATNELVGDPIPLGGFGTLGIAITPDGSRAYVGGLGVDGAAVSVIDTATNEVVGDAIGVGLLPAGIAITPDGSRAYVVSSFSGFFLPRVVSVIDTASNELVLDPIAVGSGSSIDRAIMLTPDGARAYVTNSSSGNVWVIDTATNAVVGTPIDVGPAPSAIANVPVSPPPPPPPPPPPDLFSLGFTLLERPKLPLRRLRVEAVCRGSDCELAVSAAIRVRRPTGGSKAFRLAPGTRELAAGISTRLAIPVRRTARRAVRRAVLQGRPVVVRVRARATSGERMLKRVRTARVRR